MSLSSLEEIRSTRLRKIEELRALGINPYPSRSGRTAMAGPIVEGFDEWEGREVTVAGRLMSFRKMGGLSFGHLQDETGRIQLYIRRDSLSETSSERGTLGFGELRLLDIGDIVEARGQVIRTQRGEISVQAGEVRLLAKSLRSLPEKWSGLRDREIILRQRYLDTIVNPESHARFAAIGRMLYAIRKFFHERGFLEFQTPVIQPQYGGGSAKPFRTHLNALDIDMYLAISHELYLKRLITGGYDRVYTIGRYFRNEGIDRTHHPEFSMIETMTAFENYEYNMELIESLFRELAQGVWGKTTFRFCGHEVDFGEWRRVTMVDAVREATGRDFSTCPDLATANEWLRELHAEAPQATVGHALVAAFDAAAAPGLIQPTLVYGHPVEISPLAKAMESDPRYSERFEIFIAGTECGDNWTEQNDPVVLLERWRAQQAGAGIEEGELQPLDYDFLETLEYGMAPTTGIGPGLERMAMIFTEQENIDDVIFFPLMRPRLSQGNRRIYGLAAGPADEDEDEGLPGELRAASSE